MKNMRIIIPRKDNISQYFDKVQTFLHAPP